MKKVFFVVLVALVALISSCTKEESKRIDPMAIRSQLAGIPAPTKEEILAAISKTSLKSTTDGNNIGVNLIQVFQLSVITFEVDENFATKHFVLYEINSNGFREKYLTINQRFKVRDGVIDMTEYELSFDIGCPYSRYFLLENQNNIIQINYFFRFDDGRQFAFFGENNSGSVKLPPIGGGQWQLEIIYDDGDLQQRFSTKMIDFNGDTMLSLDIKLEDENIVSYVEMENAMTRGVYSVQFITRNQDGEYTYINCPVMYNENVPEFVYFSVPFDPTIVTICGIYGCTEYQTSYLSFSFKNGKKIYRLEE